MYIINNFLYLNKIIDKNIYENFKKLFNYNTSYALLKTEKAFLRYLDKLEIKNNNINQILNNTLKFIYFPKNKLEKLKKEDLKIIKNFFDVKNVKIENDFEKEILDEENFNKFEEYFGILNNIVYEIILEKYDYKKINLLQI